MQGSIIDVFRACAAATGSVWAPPKRTVSSVVMCPLHKNKNTPALSISDSNGVWKCHAGCGGGGILDVPIGLLNGRSFRRPIPRAEQRTIVHSFRASRTRKQHYSTTTRVTSERPRYSTHSTLLAQPLSAPCGITLPRCATGANSLTKNISNPRSHLFALTQPGNE